MAYGNPDPAHPIKFVKGLITPSDVSLSVTQGSQVFAKLLYEFWGYCVNGGDDPLTPGGFASVSGTNFPSGFDSGSNTLLAAGADGNTDFGSNVFSSNSVNFRTATTGSIVNKYVVVWKKDDPSPDDSIYRIIGTRDDNSVIVDVATGGTTRLGGKAYFSSRSGLRFRLIDLVQVNNLSGWSGVLSQSLVMNLAAAPNVNPNQAISQVKLDLTSSQAVVKLVVSPSGSWTGGGFTDGTSPISQSWFTAGGTAGQGQFYFIGGRDFLIIHLKGVDGAWNASSQIQPGLHLEVPQRLYPKQNDPNPIAWFMWTNSGGTDGLSPTTGSYATGFNMVCQDGVVRSWQTLARVPTADGTHVHYSITPASGGLWYGFTQASVMYPKPHFNVLSGTYMSTDAVLHQTGSIVNPQYCLSRARLRRVRFTGRNTPKYLRLSERWVHIGGGVMWPWDGSELPHGLFWEGGGALPGEEEG